MLNYRFARLQNDGSWIVDEFQSANDDDAVSYGLLNRTANFCELYQADRLLATFDAAIPRHDPVPSRMSNRPTPGLAAEVW